MQLCCLQGKESRDITLQSKINKTQKYNHGSSHRQDLLDVQKNNKIKEEILRKGRKVKVVRAMTGRK